MAFPSDVEVLFKKGKRAASAFIHSECINCHANDEHRMLNNMCETLFDPRKSIADWDMIDWVRWIIAGGKNPDEYAKDVKRYDNATKCGLVWTANFVAYRCRTCGISPCMSLCADCFKKGNHEGHDFNMFRSQAGGACDCGDESVMRVQGFCAHHGPKAHTNIPPVPPDLLCVANAIVPRIVNRLIIHLRKHNSDVIRESDVFIKDLLHKMTEMGAAMRGVITDVLTNPNLYSSLANACDSKDLEIVDLIRNRIDNYMRARKSMANFKIPTDSEEYRVVADNISFQKELIHSNFLEELLFWTIVYEFPKELVCFLLNMLPDEKYKVAFAETFVHHYSRISVMLCQSRSNERSRFKENIHDILSNCVVHVSVQLFSNEELAVKLCERTQLLYVMIISLMIPIHGSNFEDDNLPGILMANPMHDSKNNVHYVVRCDHHILKEHWYWSIVSDLNNVLTHRTVAIMFCNDIGLLDFWLELITSFQGMNLNQRELSEHVEYENNAYYAAFSAELEICATPMWTLICHLKDSDTIDQTTQILKQVNYWLETWFKLIAFEKDYVPNPLQSTFHIPLHRYFSVFLHHAVQYQNMCLSDILPPEERLKQLLAHPLQTQIAFYEVLCGLWVRNGLQIKGQAMTYIQCHFCNSMVDADLFLIQQCATHIDSDWFIQTVMERFHVWDYLSFVYNNIGLYKGFLESDQILPMLEGALTHLATLLSVHINLGLSEEQITRKEMVALLAMSDKTHSQLMDLLPEKCGTQSSQNSYFESTLSKIAEFKSPNVDTSGGLVQGQFYPKAEIWENEFDPIHVLLRAVHRRDYQSSMDRFTQFARQSGKFKPQSQLWPPFRIPKPLDNNRFVDPRKLLHSKVLHGVIFSILYKAVYVHDIPDQILALTIYLLDMAIRFPIPVSGDNSPSQSSLTEVQDLKFNEWFDSNWIMPNLNSQIRNVRLPERRASLEGAVEEMEIDHDSSSSDSDWTDVGSDENMSDEEQPYEVHSPATSETGDGRSLESSVQRPQLPSITVPLALPPPTPSTSPSACSALVPVSDTNRQIATTNTNNQVAPVARQMQPTYTQLGLSMRYIPRPQLPGPSNSTENNNLTQDMSIVASSVGPSRLKTRTHRLKPVRVSDQRQLMNRRRHGRIFLNEHDYSNPQSQLEFTSLSDANVQQNQLEVIELMRALPASSGNLLSVNETIISLLLRLHSKLSGKSDSYVISNEINESRVGDGVFFISNFLDHYVKLIVNGERIIHETRQCIWPNVMEHSNISSTVKNEEIDREERRKRAKERQQKLMAEFASKQKAFLKNLEAESSTSEEYEMSHGESSDSEPFLIHFKEYQCVICNQSGPSTNTKLFGQVVLLQSTSVLGHASSAGDSGYCRLPCTEEEVRSLKHVNILSKYVESRVDEFDRHFDRTSWVNSLNIGWSGGVHVQSCGHYLHIDCHKSYVNSLRSGSSQQTQNRYGNEQGEYLCPLCRQMANSVLPVNPCMGEMGAVVKCRSNDISAVAHELFDLLSNVSREDPEFLRLLGGAIEDLTRATGPQYRNIRTQPTQESLFLFLCSISRTNLEVDLLIKRSKSVPCGAKKPCFVPLFHVLAKNAKLVNQLPYDNLWSQLTGITLEEQKLSLTTIEKEVPLFLRDVSALLIQIFYSLPLNVDKAYFTTVVQTLFNLNVIQALAKLSCLMIESQRIELKELSLSKDDIFIDVPHLLGFLIDTLEHSPLYHNLDEEDFVRKNKFWTFDELNSGVKNICLPFVRVASMLQHHLYTEHYPTIIDDSEEFTILIQFLGLNMSFTEPNSITRQLNWSCDNSALLIKTWCSDYMSFVDKSPIAAMKLLRNSVITWNRPSLLRLPQLYDQLFMFYHQRQCQVCLRVPKDPSICLVCGCLVCVKETCCKTENSLEAVYHSEVCGAGTAIYLVCNSSAVIVIRGKRVCVWGSVYLDCYGEEDRDLKRGKPLYLSEQRYWNLEQQWLTHSFDHATKRWIFHKDTL